MKKTIERLVFFTYKMIFEPEKKYDMMYKHKNVYRTVKK